MPAEEFTVPGLVAWGAAIACWFRAWWWRGVCAPTRPALPAGERWAARAALGLDPCRGGVVPVPRPRRRSLEPHQRPCRRDAGHARPHGRAPRGLLLAQPRQWSAAFLLGRLPRQGARPSAQLPHSQDRDRRLRPARGSGSLPARPRARRRLARRGGRRLRRVEQMVGRPRAAGDRVHLPDPAHGARVVGRAALPAARRPRARFSPRARRSGSACPPICPSGSCRSWSPWRSAWRSSTRAGRAGAGRPSATACSPRRRPRCSSCR